MKIFTAMILGLMLSSGVHCSDLEPIRSVEEFSHAMRRYEILTSTPGVVEGDISKYRENISKFLSKNKNLIKRLGDRIFVDKLPSEYQIIDSNGNICIEGLKKQILNFKNNASPVQMSKVMLAHKNNMKGEGSKIFFLDDYGVHKEHVGGIIKQIAPLCWIPKSSLEFRWDFILDLINIVWNLDCDWQSNWQNFSYKVLNLSMGCSKGCLPDNVFLSRLIFFSQSNMLVVKGAGNNGVDLTNSRADDYEMWKIFQESHQELLDGGIIIVGSIDSSYSLSSFSNRPGSSEGLQRNFIYALGDNVLAKVGDRHVRWSGTSMATPSVTGVAALIAGVYPQFSKTDIKECIFESARQSFFAYGHQVDVQDKPDMWGRGILDGAEALEYAKLKAEGKSSQEIKDILKNRKELLEKSSASKIQAVFTAYNNSLKVRA